LLRISAMPRKMNAHQRAEQRVFIIAQHVALAQNVCQRARFIAQPDTDRGD